MAVTFRKVALGEFDVLLNGEPTDFQIINGSKGISGYDRNMYGIAGRGKVKWVGSLQAAKKLVTYWITKENKLPNGGILDWFGLGPTSTTRSVKRRTVRTSTGGMVHKGYKIWKTPEGEFEVPGIEKGSLFDTVGEAKRFINNWVKQGNPGNMAKTKLDLILDKVKAKKHEVTIDVKDYTESQKQRIISTARNRGFDASSDGNFILIRDLRDNPGTSGGWIPVHAIRQLPSGDIQLLTERGTMSNPGKRKSFLKKVGKVFGKVVKTGKGVLGNPPTGRARLVKLINVYNKASDPSIPRTDVQHKIMSKRARAAMQAIRKQFIEGRDYKEFSNGMLWPK